MIITGKAPAKLNLSLDTPMRYFDGSLRWDMVTVSTDLTDYVTVETHRCPATIKVYINSGFLPSDQHNLAYQAVHILRSRFYCKDGVTVRVKKQIPIVVGLGDGSSDAAAALRILNSIWRLGLSLSELAKTALTIDSDVLYCVYNKSTHVTGHGEKIELLPPQPHYWAVTAKRKISVSTPQTLRRISYEKLRHPNNEALLTNLKKEDRQEATKHMGNVLEPLTVKFYLEIGRLEDKMKELGADAAQMSRTGPTVFAICHTKSRAKRIQNSIRGFCRDAHIIALF